MALFTKRDRVAIAVISFLILIGWGVRYAVHVSSEPENPRLIRNAVPVPEEIATSDSPAPSLVDINTAPASALENLPMIGPVKARSIVDHRDKHGPFRETADIMDVSGIGSSTFGSIRALITVAGDDSTAGGDGKHPSEGGDR